MDKKSIAILIDHAVLKPDATNADLERECRTAVECGVATACVKPSHVKEAYSLLKDSKVGVSTVIGFPSGAATTACKVFEAGDAIDNGACELDMVINVGKLLSGDLEYVREDIRQVANVAHKKGAALKVIIETSLLSDDMKAAACRLAEEAGADYVKTSTGFNGGGASLADIELMKSAVGPNMKIKASGGVKNLEQAEAFVRAGCSRLGTSSTQQILGVDSAGGNTGSY